MSLLDHHFGKTNRKLFSLVVIAEKRGTQIE